MRGRTSELLHSRDVHPRGVHSEGAHHGFRESTDAFMAVRGISAPAGLDLDPGGSQCIRELADAVVLAERRHRDTRSIQSDRLLLYQRQSEEKFIPEPIEVYGQKDVFVGRQHGQRK